MLELIWLVNRIKSYYIMAPSQITDDMKTQAATAYVQFMKTDAYKTYTKAYETFIAVVVIQPACAPQQTWRVE